MKRSLVIVNWHSSALLTDAIRTARQSSTVPLEVVVIDNSCDGDEAEAVRAAGADRVVISERNLGFGAGVNLGVSHATGDLLIIANPDVRFLGDALERLCACVRDGHAVAGPRFVWDDRGEWLLPPASSPGIAAQLITSLATRSRRIGRLRARAASRARMAFWRADWPKSVRALSGATLTMPRALFRRVGGFDPRFHLYFEEIDLLRRIRRGGGVLIHEPRAVVRHLFNQSGARRVDREAVYLESERMYHRKWFGTSFLLRMAVPVTSSEPAHAYQEGAPVERAMWLESSPEPGFASAAGHRLDRPILPPIPAEILDSLGGGPLWIRAVTADGAETGRWIAGARS